MINLKDPMQRLLFWIITIYIYIYIVYHFVYIIFCKKYTVLGKNITSIGYSKRVIYIFIVIYREISVFTEEREFCVSNCSSCLFCCIKVTLILWVGGEGLNVNLLNVTRSQVELHLFQQSLHTNRKFWLFNWRQRQKRWPVYYSYKQSIYFSTLSRR